MSSHAEFSSEFSSDLTVLRGPLSKLVNLCMYIHMHIFLSYSSAIPLFALEIIFCRKIGQRHVWGKWQSMVIHGPERSCPNYISYLCTYKDTFCFSSYFSNVMWCFGVTQICCLHSSGVLWSGIVMSIISVVAS